MATVFVLALLTGMALILLFASQTELKMSDADLRAKQAFYLAEAGTENGRQELRESMLALKSSAIGPHLQTAAGGNNAIDLDVTRLRPQFTGGTLTGFAGAGDDVPIIAPTQLGEGWFAAFITNDPADGETNLVDTNQFVLITGLGVGPSGAFEVAQALVQPGTIFPSIPATITLLGPEPEFKYKSGKGWADIECPESPKDTYKPLYPDFKGSKIWVEGKLYETVSDPMLAKGSKIRKSYNGTDCGTYRELGPAMPTPPKGSKWYATLVPRDPPPGIPGLYMPTIGVVGPDAEDDVEGEMKGSKIDYFSDVPYRTQVVPRPKELPPGGYLGEDTIADLTDPTDPTVIGSGLGTLNPTWTNCNALVAILDRLRGHADYLCTPPGCSLPATTASSLTFIDGDFRVPCEGEGYGMLVVTGSLDFPSSASWHGIVFVIGEGKFYRVKKMGFGNITGGVVVANIAGPDETYGTSDDCTGGTAGFAPIEFYEHKKAKGNTVYCSAEIFEADPGFRDPTIRQSFRQR